MNESIKAGEWAARQDINLGEINAENFEEASYDAEVNVMQAEAAKDNKASDFWFAYGSTIDSVFS